MKNLFKIFKTRVILKNRDITSILLNALLYLAVIPIILIVGLTISPSQLPWYKIIWINIAIQCAIVILLIFKTTLDFDKDQKSGKHKMLYLNKFRHSELYCGYFLYTFISILVYTLIKILILMFVFLKIGWPPINLLFFKYIFLALLIPSILFFLVMTSFIYIFFSKYQINNYVKTLLSICFMLIVIWPLIFIGSINGKIINYWGYILLAVPVLNLYSLFGEYTNLMYISIPVIAINVLWIGSIVILLFIKSKKEHKIRLSKIIERKK